MENNTLTSSSAPPTPSLIIASTTDMILASVSFAYGLVAILLNLVVLCALHTCGLNPNTTWLMYTQLCFANIVGLPADTFYPAILAFSGYPTLLLAINRLFATLKMFSIYVGNILEPVMALNRLAFVLFPSRIRTLATKFTASLCVAFALGYSAIWTLSTLFDCCAYSYMMPAKTFIYSSYAAPVQAKVGIALVLVDVAITAACYTVILANLRRIRKRLEESKNHKQLSSDGHTSYQRELNVLKQFLAIAIVWLGSIVAVSINFYIPTWRGAVLSGINDAFRNLLLIIQPLVYLLLMERLRLAVRKILCFGFKKSVVVVHPEENNTHHTH